MLGINNGCTYISEINGDHKCVSRIKGGCTFICWDQRWLHMFAGDNGGCSYMIGINGCRT